MEIRWKLWSRCLIVAGALGLGTQDALAAEPQSERDVLSWTIIAGRSGEPGQLGIKLRGTEKAKLDAWLDFDADGFFNEAEERILDRASVAPGMSVQSFEMPEGAALSASSRIRLRVEAEDGEILEDNTSLAFPSRLTGEGCNWAPGFGSVGLDNDVVALEVFDGFLYAGGDFTRVDGELAVNQVARWDGSGWTAVGSTTFGRVRALETYDDGSGAALYAASHLPPYLHRLMARPGSA
jgi:hypothetical protein